MAELKLKISDKPLPPESLGECEIRVVVGGSTRITQQMLMQSSFPPYYQKDGLPIGSITIIGPGSKPNNILADVNTYVGELATLFFGFGEVFYDGNIVYNAEILYSIWDNTNFEVVGNKVGRDYITYTATAVDPTGKESDFTTFTGKIWINVVSATNQPPSSVGDGDVSFDIGSVKVFTPAMFTTNTTPQYSDPENDPAWQLKITSLPAKGVLTFNGLPCAVGDIIPMSDIALGAFRFNDSGQFTWGQTTLFNFELNDLGSGIFVG